MSLEAPIPVRIPPAISTAQIMLYTGIKEVGDMMERTSKTVAPITEDLAKKQLEKGAKGVSSMLKSLTKASVYAWIIEQVLEAIEGFFIVLKPFLPFVTITSAIIQSFFIPVVQEWIKYLRWAYKAYASNLYHAKKMGEQLVITGGQYDDLWKAMGTFDLPDLTYDWNEFWGDWNSAWEGFFEPFGDFTLDVSDIKTDFSAFVIDFEWFSDLVADFRWPSWDGNGGGNGGDPCDDPWYAASHPWECIVGAQHGMYTGSYQGLVNVHPDEYIIPGEQMRGGGNRMEDMYYEQRQTNDYLERMYIQNRRAERRKRFKR